MGTTLSERLSIILKNSNLKQAEFAGRIGISQQHLSQICSGKRNPSTRTISDICREFGYDEVWLRTGEGDPTRQDSRSEQIMRFATQTTKDRDEFKKALVSMLAKLEPKDWEALGRIADKLLEEYKKE